MDETSILSGIWATLVDMASGKRSERWGWLVPPLCLTAALAGGWIVLGAPHALLGTAVVFFLVPILWVLASSLWPARAERTCPACKSERLERIDRSATVGITCRACGWRDESASAWLLAEEEGPLEKIVLAERRARRSDPARERAERKHASVDSNNGVD